MTLTITNPQTHFPASTAELPRIAILATGGTIAGSSPDATRTTGYQAGALGVQDLLFSLPQLEQVAKIQAEQVAQMDSKDMTCTLWQKIAFRLNAVLAQPDIAGAVITHGTDTLEETAYYLHLTLNSHKPVVITAAMRPATALSSDGPLNLLNAVCVAANPISSGRGVLVAMNNQIHCARDVVKTSTYAVDAFYSPEVGLLGWVQDNRVAFQRMPLRFHSIESEFIGAMGELPMVEVVSSYAGVSRIPVDSLVEAGVRGLVVAGTGNGSLHSVLQQALSAAVQRGVAVVRSSRVGSGHVMRNAAALDDQYDFISSGNLPPYKARVLLMLALQAGIPHVRLQSLFDRY
ncbi:asparaginase [Candidatus Pandoraea novymonadis]|uniref:L-asparaginase n=1 Tax=Candidatus Pandoraea novymonadis TaxID=1808959 RepID=A0ABX5FF79_9BURK|nr:asparaginase [Candidatus Pandoraea novymonadis]PSB91807.1 L-asparaginase [Candidatus Pandoraea novymonadis]